ncbi:MAG: hypothetical protein QT11_C0001G1004 [archaeon GW2011_AR20]|nr:MAG: hypothetical protein QT11_C0001G1004 [archaeon GW2011_AR20]AQS33438.1 hypothetical protein [uncultured archaeon]AQS33498.1 hypothetical protein [uncultured archaeon]MBS3161026.1 hypothetical protein [Candidatus Woesearchaeota archaeon]
MDKLEEALLKQENGLLQGYNAKNKGVSFEFLFGDNYVVVKMVILGNGSLGNNHSDFPYPLKDFGYNSFDKMKEDIMVFLKHAGLKYNL